MNIQNVHLYNYKDYFRIYIYINVSIRNKLEYLNGHVSMTFGIFYKL